VKTRRTRSVRACRSTSERSSASHSDGRRPVQAATIGIAAYSGLQLVGDGLHVGRSGEHGDLAPLRLRVRDGARRVLVQQLHRHRVVEDLPNRLRDVPRRTLGERLSPRPELRYGETIDAHGARRLAEFGDPNRLAAEVRE
jgi:hypothetical protein